MFEQIKSFFRISTSKEEPSMMTITEQQPENTIVTQFELFKKTSRKNTIAVLETEKAFATEEYVNQKILEANISGGADISQFATKSDLLSKVDKAYGKSLMDDAEMTRLANVYNYNDIGIKNNINDINSEMSLIQNNLVYVGETQPTDPITILWMDISEN